MPPMYSIYIFSILKDRGCEVDYSRNVNKVNLNDYDYIIMTSSIICHETEINLDKVIKSKKILVVGAGPAGLAYAVTAAKRGHQVTLMEKSNSIGGQFNMAKIIPGKEEFYETIRYFSLYEKVTRNNF